MRNGMPKEWLRVSYKVGDEQGRSHRRVQTFRSNKKGTIEPGKLTDTCRPASNPNVLLVPESIREWFRCRILRPLLRQLRGGVTPRRLAWSLALGVVVGINPSVGLTTLVVILLAWAFGLNQIASQIGSHAAAPLHLLLFLPFIQLGVYLFHTRRLPLSRQQFEHLSHHPVRLFHAIWQWACPHSVGPGGRDGTPTARDLSSTSTGADDAPPSDVAAFAPRGALRRLDFRRIYPRRKTTLASDAR